MHFIKIALIFLQAIVLISSTTQGQQAGRSQQTQQTPTLDPVANAVNSFKNTLDKAIPELKKVFHSALVGFGGIFVHPYGWLAAAPAYIYLDTEKLSTAAAPFLLACLYYKTNRARGIYAFLFPLYKYMY
jgi:hypothetical protein